ncbi:hypothetical protein EYF80_006806 [Liparis tanakae]|uniref:Uncharacterized protein n=1 Tax=Liparis tanakae TaxID=230148 RepID=A0A4Z2IXY8_9TELE|nr:hypothetical protein EYF80_006806 [Liparis tanakae]
MDESPGELIKPAAGRLHKSRMWMHTSHYVWVGVLGPRRDRCSSADRLTVFVAIVMEVRPADVRGSAIHPAMAARLSLKSSGLAGDKSQELRTGLTGEQPDTHTGLKLDYYIFRAVPKSKSLFVAVKVLEEGVLESEATEAAPCWPPNNAVEEPEHRAQMKPGERLYAASWMSSYTYSCWKVIRHRMN